MNYPSGLLRAPFRWAHATSAPFHARFVSDCRLGCSGTHRTEESHCCSRLNPEPDQQRQRQKPGIACPSTKHRGRLSIELTMPSAKLAPPGIQLSKCSFAAFPSLRSTMVGRQPLLVNFILRCVRKKRRSGRGTGLGRTSARIPHGLTTAPLAPYPPERACYGGG